MASKYYGIREVLKRGVRIGYATERMHYVNNLEVLVGIVSGVKYAIAADLTDAKEYRAFYNACAKGDWIDIELYRLPKSEVSSCSDEGRITVKQLDKALGRSAAKRK